MTEQDPFLFEASSPLLAEIRECLGEVLDDFTATIDSMDPETVKFARTMAFRNLTSGKDPEEMVADIGGGFLWWFLLGREHARRGYQDPLARDDEPVISDDDISKFLGDPE